MSYLYSLVWLIVAASITCVMVTIPFHANGLNMNYFTPEMTVGV